MSEENDEATAAEEAGKKALEEQKAKEAEQMAALQDAELSAEEAAAEREARAQEVADSQAADEAARQESQEDAAEEQAAREEEIEEGQADYEAQIEDAAAEDAAARRAEDGDDRTAEELADDIAEMEEDAAEAHADQGSMEATEEELDALEELQDEGTPLEQLEDGWNEGGFMVYGSRMDLLEQQLSNWFNWFPPLRKFPEVNFNFIVLAGLDFLGEFKSVSGISKSLPAKKVNEGGRLHAPHFLPYNGPASRGELKLEWGAVSPTSMYEWIEAVRIGWAFHRDVIVVQLARDGFPTRFMRFGNCWPTGWSGADLDTSGSSWALQSLNLVYDDFNMITVPIDLGATVRG